MIFLGSIRSGDQSDAPAKASMLAQGMVIRTPLRLIHSFRVTIVDEDGLLGDVSEASLPANNPSVACGIVQTHLYKWRTISAMCTRSTCGITVVGRPCTNP